MARACYRLIATLLLLTWCPTALAGGVALTSVKLARSGRTTRVSFRLSGKTPFRYFALGSPPRAVLDMHDTHDRWRFHTLSDAAIRGLRMARHRNGTLRAVLDLRPGARLLNVSHAGARTLVMRIAGGKARATSARAAPPLRRSSTAPQPGRRPPASAQPVSFHAVPQSGPIVVAIDPGHGGKDPGTTGPHGLHEKTVTLAIARILYRKLERTPHIHPILTRDRDVYVSLPERVEIAQRQRANLFVSIHENAYPRNPRVDGGTCYILSTHGASNAEAAQLAHFENSADPAVDGVHFTHNRVLNQVLTDLFQAASIDAAYHLAHDIITQFGHVEPIYDRTVQRANFAVLRDPMIPSVLCETAFLSNPHQAWELHHHRFRSEIADAIYRGILRYLHTYAPMRIQPARRGYYVAQAGDTLSGIAAAHHVSVRRLQALNHLQGTSIEVGERLRLPGSASAPARLAGRHATQPMVAYRVRRGDTLSAIAVRHHTTVARLEKLNVLHGTALRVGERLRVPARHQRLRRYVVHSGDTLSQLAQSHGISTRRLERLNHLSDPEIRVGEVLRVPYNDNGSI